LGEAALEAAFRLRPDSAEAHLSLARHLYLGYLDYDNALAELEIARRVLPNDPRIFELTGYIRRRQGRLDEGVENLERALQLDPRNLFILQQLALSYDKLRRYPDMAATLDRALTIKPNDVESEVARGLVDFEWKGDTRRLHQTIDSVRSKTPEAIPSVADSWLYCALAERDPTAAEAALVALGDGYIGNDAPRFHRKFAEGLIGRMMNDKEKAQAAFTAARTEQEKIVQAQPDYGPVLCTLAIIDAGLGRKEEALREGRRAVELTPVAKDALNGAQVIGGFAIVAAWIGETELACEQLETNIRLRGYGLTAYGQLKLSPFWDPLRGDPRFEKIVASLAPQE
jgi:tetratricopeptide (TPR) repeat protein